MHIRQHFMTITKHRHMVMRMCFKIGLYRQGLMHDLSKYSPTEFIRGCIYYQGFKSPNNKEREVKGFSQSWLHHKGRNRHHFEYWLDYDHVDPSRFSGMPMPRKYIAEMICDRIAACRVYEKEKYSENSPLDFFLRGKGKELMHPETTRKELGFLLLMLAQEGQDKTLKYIKDQYLKGEPVPSSYIEPPYKKGQITEFG